MTEVNKNEQKPKGCMWWNGVIALTRLGGYGNQIGESLRYAAPRFLYPGYFFTFSYVFFDAYDKA